MATANLIQLNDLSGDFRALTGPNRLINDAILGGPGAPAVAPPEQLKVWAWVNTTTSKISHYWNPLTLAWVPVVDDDILTRYPLEGTWANRPTGLVAGTPEHTLYTNIGFRFTDLMPDTRFLATGSSWIGAQAYPATYSVAGTISPGDTIHYEGIPSLPGAVGRNELVGTGTRIVSASYGSEGLVGTGTETELIFDFVRSNNGSLLFTLNIPVRAGNTRVGTLFNMTLNFFNGLTPRCIYQGGLTDPTRTMTGGSVTLLLVPFVNNSFDISSLP